MPPPSPQFLSPITPFTTTVTTVATTTLTATCTSEHMHHHPYNTKTSSAATNHVATTAAPAKDDGGASFTDVATAAASRLISELINSTTPGHNQELVDFTTELSRVAELSTGEAEMGTSGLSGEASGPASPSEGSESLGSHSQTEVASIIERGDTATPDTHSDVQDQDISCSEMPEPENNLMLVSSDRNATSD